MGMGHENWMSTASIGYCVAEDAVAYGTKPVQVDPEEEKPHPPGC